MDMQAVRRRDRLPGEATDNLRHGGKEGRRARAVMQVKALWILLIRGCNLNPFTRLYF